MALAFILMFILGVLGLFKECTSISSTPIDYYDSPRKQNIKVINEEDISLTELLDKDLLENKLNELRKILDSEYD